MKKTISAISLFFLIITFYSCTVNECAGLIKVENKTDLIIKNIKIGDRIITFQIDPGASYYYWFYDTIYGELKAEGIEVFNGNRYEEEGLEVNYWVYITASNYGPGNKLLVLNKEKH